MPAVKFTHLGSSPVLGNFSAGDVYRGDAAICRHLVEEARCAEWLDLPTESRQGDSARADGTIVQEPLDAAQQPAEGPTVDDLKAALTARSISFRANASKATLQALLDAAQQPAEGPTVDDLKAALTARSISFRANASKATLQALLDAAQQPAD